MWEDLQALRRKLVKAGSTDSLLRQWSQGIVGDKTFQQITEEFAGIVIPKVWKREGRKISRVAAQLSISPKKVRRILSSAGLIGGKAEHSKPSRFALGFCARILLDKGVVIEA